jgi:hypothetical protein
VLVEEALKCWGVALAGVLKNETNTKTNTLFCWEQGTGRGGGSQSWCLGAG